MPAFHIIVFLFFNLFSLSLSLSVFKLPVFFFSGCFEVRFEPHKHKPAVT
jgi:hypothetical protein